MGRAEIHRLRSLGLPGKAARRQIGGKNAANPAAGNPRRAQNAHPKRGMFPWQQKTPPLRYRPPPFAQVLENIRNLSQRQKIADDWRGAGFAIALVVGVILWSRQPDYAVLFSNLATRTAAPWWRPAAAERAPPVLRQRQRHPDAHQPGPRPAPAPGRQGIPRAAWWASS